MTRGRFACWTRLANALAISRRELTWAAAAAGLVILLTSIPYLYGWAITPPGMVYMGYVYDRFDHGVHSAWVRQAQMGRWLFESLFTTEPQSPHFFNLYFLLIGRLARYLHLSITAVEQLGRVVFGWAFLVVAYAFAAQFTQSVFTRRLALLLIGLSSGLGWLVNAHVPTAEGAGYLHTWAMDYVPGGTMNGLIMPEAITFPSLMIFDLFAAAYFLLIGTFYLLWLAWQRGSWRLAACAALAAMILANVHSYDIITVWAVGAVALAVLAILQRRLPRRELGMFAAVAALSVIPVIYQYHVFLTSQVFREKANSPTLSPPFDLKSGRAAADYLIGELKYVLTFGLCAFAALPAIVRAARRRHPGWLYLAAWAVVPFVLVYLPFSFQRKIAEGMHVPLSMLAALAIGDMLLQPRPFVGRRKTVAGGEARPLRQWSVAVVFLALAVPSNVALTGLILRDLRDDSRYRTFRLGQPSPGFGDIGLRDIRPSYYLHADEIEAMEWLTAHSKPGDAILSLPGTGMYLPPVTGRHAYCAHIAETLNVHWKIYQVLRFFGNPMPAADGTMLPPMTDAERLALAKANRLKYVYYGCAEQGFAMVRPQQIGCLELVHRNRRVQIYAFKAGARR